MLREAQELDDLRRIAHVRGPANIADPGTKLLAQTASTVQALLKALYDGRIEF